IEQVQHVLEKKEAGRPITAEDYSVLSRLVAGVEGNIIAKRAESHAEVRRERAEIRKRIPAIAWKLPLEELDLPGRIHNLLLDNELDTVGDVLLNLEIDDQIFLEYRGFGDKMLETLKEYVAVYQLPEGSELELVAEDVEDVELVQVEIDAEAVAETPVVEVEETIEEVIIEEPAVVVEEEIEELVEEVEEETTLADEEVVEEEEPEPLSAIDDLSKSIFEIEPETKKKKKPSVVIASPSSKDEDEFELDERGRRRGRRLIYDEDLGEVVIKRKRKGSRGRPEWEDFDPEDL
ncbi:MAG: hypothetical protein R3293_20045, partial [Candidatus Promineifilaceae bacterium]|nr:hypothetical protein [Candidatus Promineifilaceae bacterium]